MRSTAESNLTIVELVSTTRTALVKRVRALGIILWAKTSLRMKRFGEKAMDQPHLLAWISLLKASTEFSPYNMGGLGTTFLSRVVMVQCVLLLKGYLHTFSIASVMDVFTSGQTSTPLTTGFLWLILKCRIVRHGNSYSQRQMIFLRVIRSSTTRFMRPIYMKLQTGYGYSI